MDCVEAFDEVLLVWTLGVVLRGVSWFFGNVFIGFGTGVGIIVLLLLEGLGLGARFESGIELKIGLGLDDITGLGGVVGVAVEFDRVGVGLF